MAIGVLLLAVGSYLGGKDHGIGSVVTRPGFPNEVTLSFDLVAGGDARLRCASAL